MDTSLIGMPHPDILAYSLEFRCYKRRESFIRIHFRFMVANLNFQLPFILESVQENTIEFAVSQSNKNCVWLVKNMFFKAAS